VREAAVLALPEERLGELVCAVLVLEDGARLNQGEMIEFLTTQQLARQKLPQRIEVVETLPRTSSGKVQKHRLVAAFAENQGAADR
jgi:cyclohexanecarboxylate-CoA ligase